MVISMLVFQEFPSFESEVNDLLKKWSATIAPVNNSQEERVKSIFKNMFESETKLDTETFNGQVDKLYEIISSNKEGAYIDKKFISDFLKYSLSKDVEDIKPILISIFNKKIEKEEKECASISEKEHPLFNIYELGCDKYSFDHSFFEELFMNFSEKLAYKELSSKILELLNDAANGKAVTRLFLEELIKFPFPPINIDGYKAFVNKTISNFEELRLQRNDFIKLHNHFHNPEFLEEQQRRILAGKNFSQLHFSVLNASGISTTEDSKPSTLLAIKINNYLLRNKSHVSVPETPPYDPMQLLIPTSPFQKSLYYTRDELDNPNLFYVMAKEKIIDILQYKVQNEESEGEIKELTENGDFILINDKNFTPNLNLSENYFNLNDYKDPSKKEELKEKLKEIFSGTRNKYFLGYSIDEKESDKVGKLLFNTTEYFKGIINEVIESYPVEQRSVLIKKVALCAISEIDKMPFIYISKLAKDDDFLSNKKIVKEIVTHQGFSPTMQKIQTWIGKQTPFAHILKKGDIVLGSSQEPIEKFKVKNLDQLLQHKVYIKFKNVGRDENRKLIFPGIVHIIDATCQWIEGFNSKEGKEKLLKQFSKTGGLAVFEASLGNILSIMDNVNQFKLGILDRDMVDISFAFEHIMEEVFMWLDTPEPTSIEVRESDQKELLHNQAELEDLMAETQFDDLKPDYNQFTSGGMKSLANIYRAFASIKKPVQVGSANTNYYTSDTNIESIAANLNFNKVVSITKETNYEDGLDSQLEKIQANKQKVKDAEKEIETLISKGKTQDDKEVQEIKAKIELLKKDGTEIDLLFVDVHASPQSSQTEIISLDLEKIVQKVMDNECESSIFTLVIDTTIPIKSELIKRLRKKWKYKLNIVTFKSCQKNDQCSLDKLSGGFISIFSKNPNIIEAFQRFKKQDVVEKFNVDSFLHLFRYGRDRIKAHAQMIAENTSLCYDLLNKEYLYDPNQKQDLYFIPRKDKDSYYFLIGGNPGTFNRDNIMEEIREGFLKMKVPLKIRPSFTFLWTSIDGIGPSRIRIKVGIESPKTIKRIAETFNQFFKKKNKATIF